MARLGTGQHVSDTELATPHEQSLIIEWRLIAFADPSIKDLRPLPLAHWPRTFRRLAALAGDAFAGAFERTESIRWLDLDSSPSSAPTYVETKIGRAARRERVCKKV